MRGLTPAADPPLRLWQKLVLTLLASIGVAACVGFGALVVNLAMTVFRG